MTHWWRCSVMRHGAYVPGWRDVINAETAEDAALQLVQELVKLGCKGLDGLGQVVTVEIQLESGMYYGKVLVIGAAQAIKEQFHNIDPDPDRRNTPQPDEEP